MDATKLAKSVHPKLKDKSTWKPWSQIVLMLLEGMPDNTWLTALEQDPPESDPAKQQIHKQVRSFLILSADELVQRDLIAYSNAKEVWTAAKKRYGVASRLEVSIHLSRFWGDMLKQGQTIAEYIREKRRLAAIINDAGKKKLDDPDLVGSVLAGCRSQYESVIENLATSANLDLETLESRLRDSEQSRKLSATTLAKVTHSDVTAAATVPEACSFCHKPGHQMSKCFKKNPCDKCSKTGHPPWRCPKRNKNLADSGKEADSTSSALLTGNSKSLEATLASAFTSALAKFSNEVSPSSYSAFSRSFLSRGFPATRTIADSGSSKTLLSARDSFLSYSPTNIPISMAAEGSQMQAKGKGLAALDSIGIPSRTSPALHVPALGSLNLLSVSHAVCGDRHMIFDENGCELRSSNGITEASGHLSNDGLYVMDPGPRRRVNLRSTCGNDLALTTTIKPTRFQRDRVHDRLCHRHLDAIMRLSNRDLVANLWTATNPKIDCDACHVGKARKQPFPSTSVVTIDDIEIAEILSVDICGKLPVASLGGARYFVTFIEHRSRKRFTFLLKTRQSLVLLSLLKRVKAYVERRTGRSIKVLRYDNAGEFVSVIFQEFLAEQGIESQRTVPHCSTQNQVSERNNLTLLDGACALLFRSRLPEPFWGLAVLCVSYVSQFWPHPLLPDTTPYQEFYQKTPDVGDLRTFGCDAYVFDDKATKTQFRGKKMIFVGYPDNQKGWRLMDPFDHSQIITARHVIFDETSFGDRSLPLSSLQMPRTQLNQVVDSRPCHQQESDEDTDDDDEDTLELPDKSEPALARVSESTYDPSPTLETNSNVNPAPRRSTRVRRPPDRLSLCATDDSSMMSRISTELDFAQETATSFHTRAIHGAVYLDTLHRPDTRRRFSDYGNLRQQMQKTLAAHSQEDDPEDVVERIASLLSTSVLPGDIESDPGPTDPLERIFEPSSIAEARACPDWPLWKAAIDRELREIVDHDTWSKVASLPDGRKAIGCRWVFVVKYKNTAAKGAPPRWVVDRYKARLTAKGYAQQPGVDFTDTFAPVIRPAILCLLFALSLEDPNVVVHSLDVKNAFLNGVLTSPVYMNSPPGIYLGVPFVKLHKTLYGLKQASREWHQVLRQHLVDVMKLTPVKSCQCIFIRRSAAHWCIIALYVDDCVLFAHPDVVASVKREILSRFKATDLGETQTCLGIAVTQNRPERTISLSQSKAVSDLLRNHGFDTCRPLSTPCSLRLTTKMCPQTQSERDTIRTTFESRLPFRTIVCSLLWITYTRPDISFAVGQLARFMDNPGRAHYHALKHVLKYLSGTRHYALVLRPSSSKLGPILRGYSDSDYAGDCDTRRSTTGYAFMIGSGAICRSHLQKSVSLSSCEAEYMATCDAAREAVFLRTLLGELGFKQCNPTTICVDNQSMINYSKNFDQHSRMKHIEIRQHFVRELVQSDVIQHQYCPTDEMPADIFTKPLGGHKFAKFRSMLGVEPI
jgi:transposase InsO family protein